MLSQLLFLAATAATAVQAAVLPTDTFDTTSIITSRNVLGEASIVNRCYDDLWLYSMTAGVIRSTFTPFPLPLPPPLLPLIYAAFN
jgi:hypothetical protein